MSVRVFFSVVGRRRRRSSVISLFRHRDGPVKKNQLFFFAVFQKQAIFPKFKIFRQNECTRFFWRRRSSPWSVVRHFPLSSQGWTCEKNQILAVFPKQAIFPKFKIFRQNESTRFFLLLSVVGHLLFPSFVTGTDLWKNQILAVFQKQAIFPKFKIFSQNECTRFFGVVGRRRRPSFPSFVTGTDLWKKSNSRRFSNTSNLSKIQDF